MARLKTTIIFDSGARLGPGKIALLESIRDTGSISAASRSMGMDYKRAWTLLESINQTFLEPVVLASPGGTRGGGAQLTPFALDLLQRYRRIEGQAASVASADIAVLEAHARPSIGEKI